MPHDEVIPLSRWRAALARARQKRRADTLLAEPDADRLIPKLPVQELYYAIQEVGLADAHELVELASPAQVRGLVDLDVWQRDQLDDAKLGGWLEVMAEAGPNRLAAAVEALDAEVIALWLMRQARVYDLSLEEALPEEPEGHFYPTPDRFFLLDILPGGEQGRAIEHIIDWLYRSDLELARRVVMSAKWELASDLEEWSYRWRQGRMADLGYVDYYDALGIYRFLDPASVRSGEGSSRQSIYGDGESCTLPAQLASALDEQSFFARSLATVSGPAELERLQSVLLLLVNKAMSADLVEAGDVKGAEETMRRVVGTLGLGLEYLSRGQVAATAGALESVALERIFRVGFSLTLQLKRLAETLLKKGQVALALGAPPEPVLLLDEPYDRLVTALTLARPLYVPVDEAGPARPFQTLAEVARTAQALDDAARAAPLVFRALALAPESLNALLEESATAPAELRLGTLVRTGAAHLLAGDPLSAKPLRAAQLAKVRRRAKDARAELERALGGEQALALARWLDGWFSDFAGALDRPGGLLIRIV